MSEEPLIAVEQVYKKYCRSLKRSLWYGVQDIASELLGTTGGNRLDLRKGEFLAIEGVSFEVRRGECLGLIGANGAGKSTLLKMLNGLIRPDAGEITIRGRISALIELGAGFNPVLTGRENVYVNAAILGLSKSETEARFRRIVDFAELEEFIDSPLQNYSSGMRVRLGFAIAAHCDPDVLLLDEVLAVGDLSFQSKCLNHISRTKPDCAVVFVSHDMRMISRLCDRVLYLGQGRQRVLAEAELAIHAMRQDLGDEAPGERYSSQELAITEVQLGTGGATLHETQPLQIDMLLDCKIPLDDAVFHFAVFRADGVQCFGVLSSPFRIHDSGRFRVRGTFPDLTLMPGRYSVNAGVHGSDRTTHFALWLGALRFTVSGSDATIGMVKPKVEWHFDECATD